jgi:hypothetical protein
MPAPAAAAVVVVHDALPDRRLRVRDARPPRSHDAAGLVTGDHGIAGATETERACGVASGSVSMQIAAAHARRLDGQDDLSRTRGRIREVAKLELTVAEEHDAAHEASLSNVAR